MKYILIIIVVLLMFGILCRPSDCASPSKEKTIYDFTIATMDGENKSLADYKGKTLLIVNTASKCGFTGQYAGLEELYKKYQDKGFYVLAFPANSFLGQEPGTNEEIKKFCGLKYKTTFPLFAKISVKGRDIAPLYKYLTAQPGFDGDITWNFNKFLINSDGHVAARFGSKVLPMDDSITLAIEKLL